MLDSCASQCVCVCSTCTRIFFFSLSLSLVVSFADALFVHPFTVWQKFLLSSSLTWSDMHVARRANFFLSKCVCLFIPFSHQQQHHLVVLASMAQPLAEYWNSIFAHTNTHTQQQQQKTAINSLNVAISYLWAISINSSFVDAFCYKLCDGEWDLASERASAHSISSGCTRTFCEYFQHIAD